MLSLPFNRFFTYRFQEDIGFAEGSTSEPPPSIGREWTGMNGFYEVMSTIFDNEGGLSFGIIPPQKPYHITCFARQLVNDLVSIRHPDIQMRTRTRMANRECRIQQEDALFCPVF